MNQDIIRSQWKELAPNIKQHWSKLTDADLKVSEGGMDYLADKVEKRYGIAHSETEKQVREFERELSKHSATHH